MFIEHKEVGEYQRLDEASKLLLKAADLIETHGHAKKAFDINGYCAWGAIAKSETGRAFQMGYHGHEARQRVMNHLGIGGLWSWNDDDRTTKETVVSTFRAVALGQ